MTHMPPPPYGSQPGWAGMAQPPPAPKKASKLPWILGGIGVFTLLCCGGGLVATLASSDDPKVASPPAVQQPEALAPATPAEKPEATEKPEEKVVEEKPATYKVGQAVRGGDFEFTVHGVKCGLARVGDEYLNRKAQGQFCRADITAKNVTRSAHLFHADNTVSAADGEGRTYSADGEANIYGNDDGSGFLDEVNPGNSVRAFVFFDIPKGVKLKTIIFDAGLFTLAEDAVVTL